MVIAIVIVAVIVSVIIIVITTVALKYSHNNEPVIINFSVAKNEEGALARVLKVFEVSVN